MVWDPTKSVRGLSKDEILEAIGMRTRASDVVFPAVGAFLAGILVGAGIAMMVAPKSGPELRRELGQKADELRERVASGANEIAGELRSQRTGSEEQERSGKLSGGMRSGV